MITHQDDINLTDAHFFAKGDIHDLFRRMRAEDPVHWTQGKLKRGFWSIFKHEDAYTVYKGASEYFSNGKFSVGLPSSPEIEAAFSPEITGCNRMLVASDGELHRDFRKAFNAMFLPRAIKQYEASGRKLVLEILDEVLPRGRCEFVTEVATRLPMAIICDMMAIPRKDWQLMFDLVNQGMGAEDPEYQVEGSAVETRNQAWGQAVAYCTKLALERRGSSATDLLTVIANSRVAGGRELSVEEIGYNGFMFIIGGLDTTRNSIAGGLLELMRDRSQMQRLREDKSLMRPAVEEILRWTSAITHSMRTALKDTEIRGRKIKEGDWVVVWNASANRDEDAFVNADKFDVGRDPNDHFAFAYGEHFCLGAHLARLEIRLIFEEILDRMPDVELDGEVEWLASNLLHGVKRMPIKFTPRRAAAA
ncbi:MAG TPA: cytochrome P450 [Candidatus Binataceae bacterium]|jgi:cytochrome P450|nr:cytochrome P450 [Candidatus Binataceae bacterium]